MELPDAIDKVRPCVVQIGLRTSKSELPHILGTGFLVDDRATVITAWHVLKAGMGLAQLVELQTDVTFEDPPFVAAIAHPRLIETSDHGTLRMDEGFYYFDMRLLASSDEHDLAACRIIRNNPFEGLDPDLIPEIGGVKSPPEVGVAEIDATRPRDGTAIAASGYPFAINTLVTNSGCIATAWHVELPPRPEHWAEPDGEGLHVEFQPFDEMPKDRYLADIEVNPGNSGGPVYLQGTGEVVGVCISSRYAPVGQIAADGTQKTAKIDGDTLVYSSGLTVVIPCYLARGRGPPR